MTRVLAAPDNDPDDINGGRSPLSLCLATGTSAMDGFLSTLEGKDDEISLDLANVGNQAYHNANPRGTVGYPMDSLGGLTLKDISETMLIGDPKVAGVSFLFILFLFFIHSFFIFICSFYILLTKVHFFLYFILFSCDYLIIDLRHKVLEYIQRMPNKISIFSEKIKSVSGGFRGGKNVTWEFIQDQDDNDPPTIKFVQELRLSLGKENELPPVDPNLTTRKRQRMNRGGTPAANADSMLPIEQKARWLTSSWNLCPEVALLRDMHLLYRISLEPYSSFKKLNDDFPELWYEQNSSPSYGISQTDPRGKVIVLGITLGDLGFDFNSSLIPSPASIGKFVQPNSGPTATEEDVLHQESLENFDNSFR